MSRNMLSGRGLHCWRAALIVIFVVPAILCASGVKVAHASFHKPQPVLCDGIDDDTGPPIRCALVEGKTKEFSPTKARSHALGKVLCPLTSRSRVTPARTERSISFADSPRRIKRVLTDDPGSSADPDSSH